jgi:hypothetical protein
MGFSASEITSTAFSNPNIFLTHSFLLLLRSLYILSVLRITAVFISRHLGPVIPTLAIMKKQKGSPQQVTHLPQVWDLLLALA